MKNKLLYYSQAGQDQFALSVARHQSYIEIGANDYKKSNNTYPLEVLNGWKGFSIELNQKKFKNNWESQSERTNRIYWDNAITFDYARAVLDNGMSTRVGYLSCDIEPAENTLNALKKVVTDGITFDCITFEHDYYKNKSNYHQLAVEFLAEHGYRVAVNNVFAMNKPARLFETWFVRNDIDFNNVEYSNWAELFKH